MSARLRKPKIRIKTIYSFIHSHRASKISSSFQTCCEFKNLKKGWKRYRKFMFDSVYPLKRKKFEGWIQFEGSKENYLLLKFSQVSKLVANLETWRKIGKSCRKFRWCMGLFHDWKRLSPKTPKSWRMNPKKII